MSGDRCVLRVLGVLALLVCCAFCAPLRAQNAPSHLDQLSIDTAGGVVNFNIEVMRSDEERERGLMFRRFMPADRGMLFDFTPDQNVMMWMKNTYIPLDMLFISRDGHILTIAENTEPLSERIIASGVAVAAVLEINAGSVARWHIRKGDVVHHSMFH
jgi:uncharacterized membrane protein (UPF0127 family)